MTRFYEKVVKVKADVAAILNFFSRLTPQIEADHLDAVPVVPTGGMRKGGSAERFETTLRGEPRHRWVPALFAGAQRASGVGGTRPPRLSPGGGNGKGGDQTSLPPAVRGCVAPMAGSPLVECVLAVLPLFSPLRSATYRSISRSAFRKSCQRHPPLPCFYPHSEWAVRGPVQVGGPI
jgi:hypothetical protein